MGKTYFMDPNGNYKEVTDLAKLKVDIVDNFETFWMDGSGDGYFEYFAENEEKTSLLIGPNVEYGMYLHFMDRDDKGNGVDLLSLYDAARLDEVAETAEEIYASVGLFLPVEKAWEAIVDFVERGKPSDKVTWITPDDIPDEGNW